MAELAIAAGAIVGVLVGLWAIYGVTGADDPVEAESSVGYEDAGLRARLDAATLRNVHPVSPQHAAYVHGVMKRTIDRPLRAVGTATRSLKVEVR